MDSLPVYIPDDQQDLDFSDRVFPDEYRGHFQLCLLKYEDIVQVVKALAQRIHEDYKGRRPVFLCTLKGANPFFQNLLEALQELRQGYYMEFLRVSSYDGTSTKGDIQVGGGVKYENLTGKDVIIVEDLIDTGTTLAKLVPFLMEQAKPLSIEVCTILAKRLEEPAKYEAKYLGFSVPGKHFLGGYGLDCDECYRDCRDVWALSEHGIAEVTSGRFRAEH